MNHIVTKTIALLAVPYIVAYAVIRCSTDIIIHRYGHVGCKYDSHHVEIGDSGGIIMEINHYPQLHSTTFQPDPMPERIELFFAPLRFAEIGYWYITQPVGSPIPEQDRKVLQCQNKNY